MAEIDSNFPFNRLGLPLLGENGNGEETGALSRLRRAQEDRQEQREAERLRPRESENEADSRLRAREPEPRPVEDVVRRETETEPARRLDLGVERRFVGEPNEQTGLRFDENNPDNPRPFTPIEQAIAAVIRRPGNLELRPQAGDALATEPGGEGPVGELVLPLDPPVLDRRLPRPPEPEPELQQRREEPPPVETATEPRNRVREQPDSNIERLVENPAALRTNFLETDPALRANRELRDFLAENPDTVNENRAPGGGEQANRLLNENQPTLPPGVQPETVAARQEEARQARVEDAQRNEEILEARRAERERREEEQETRPVRQVDPESLVTRRGFNINQII